MRGQSQIKGGGARRGGKRSIPLEDPYFGEPGPIVIAEKRSGAVPVEAPEFEDVDPIEWPPPKRGLVLEPAFETEPQDEPLALAPTAAPAPAPVTAAAAPPWRGLAAGLILGALVGGGVALNIARPRPVAPPPQGRPMIAQSVTSVRAPVPAPQPAEPPLRGGIAPPSPKALPAVATSTQRPPAIDPPRGGLDLERLARAIVGSPPQRPAAPPAPAAPPGGGPLAASAVEPPPPLPARTIDPPRVIEAPRLLPPAITPPAPRPVASERPSFDCNGAAAATQQLICSDAGLALADRRLSLAYDAAMASAFDRPALREDQQRWLQDRDRLGADRAAVAAFYQSRMIELAAKTREDRRRGGLFQKR